MASPVIDARGIRDLQRDLKKVDKEMAKGMTKELRQIGDSVRDKVRGSTAAPYKTGKLRRSVKTSVRKAGISLYSNEPQAGVWHWGGTISPRGTPIEIPATEFITGEVYRESKNIEEQMGDLLDNVARRYAGFH